MTENADANVAKDHDDSLLAARGQPLKYDRLFSHAHTAISESSLGGHI
jgi:hypothetical protein